MVRCGFLIALVDSGTWLRQFSRPKYLVRNNMVVGLLLHDNWETNLPKGNRWNGDLGV